MHYNYILFDLDGTLSDPMVGICSAVQHALRHFDIEVEDIRTLVPFIGPPLRHSFMELYGIPAERIEEAHRAYDEYYIEGGGMYENTLYPGIGELLSRLRAAGKQLYLATSKPEPLAKDILRHFGLDGYFHFIGGDTPEHTRSAKAEVIRYVLAENPDIVPSQTIMIGDRKFDMAGARANGIDSIGVLYGYGNREELTEAGANYIVEDLKGLEGLLLGE